MVVQLKKDEQGRLIGYSLKAEEGNQEEVNKINAIRDMIFFGFDDTHLEYNGRTDSTDSYAGELHWIQKKHKK